MTDSDDSSNGQEGSSGMSEEDINKTMGKFTWENKGSDGEGNEDFSLEKVKQMSQEELEARALKDPKFHDWLRKTKGYTIGKGAEDKRPVGHRTIEDYGVDTSGPSPIHDIDMTPMGVIAPPRESKKSDSSWTRSRDERKTESEKPAPSEGTIQHDRGTQPAKSLEARTQGTAPVVKEKVGVMEYLGGYVLGPFGWLSQRKETKRDKAIFSNLLLEIRELDKLQRKSSSELLATFQAIGQDTENAEGKMDEVRRKVIQLAEQKSDNPLDLSRGGKKLTAIHISASPEEQILFGEIYEIITDAKKAIQKQEQTAKSSLNGMLEVAEKLRTQEIKSRSKRQELNRLMESKNRKLEKISEEGYKRYGSEAKHKAGVITTVAVGTMFLLGAGYAVLQSYLQKGPEDLTAAQAKIVQVETERDDYKTYKTKNDSLESTLENERGELRKTRGELARSKRSSQSLYARIKKSADEIRQLSGDNSKLEAKVNLYDGDKKTADAKIINVNAKMIQLQSNLNAALRSVKDQAAVYKKQEESLNKKIQDNGTKIEGYKTKITELDQKLAKSPTKQNITLLQDQMGELQRQNGRLEKTLAQAQENYQSAQRQIAIMKSSTVATSSQPEESELIKECLKYMRDDAMQRVATHKKGGNYAFDLQGIVGTYRAFKIKILLSNPDMFKGESFDKFRKIIRNNPKINSNTTLYYLLQKNGLDLSADQTQKQIESNRYNSRQKK